MLVNQNPKISSSSSPSSVPVIPFGVSCRRIPILCASANIGIRTSLTSSLPRCPGPPLLPLIQSIPIHNLSTNHIELYTTIRVPASSKGGGQPRDVMLHTTPLVIYTQQPRMTASNHPLRDGRLSGCMGRGASRWTIGDGEAAQRTEIGMRSRMSGKVTRTVYTSKTARGSHCMEDRGGRRSRMGGKGGWKRVLEKSGMPPIDSRIDRVTMGQGTSLASMASIA